MSYDVLEVGGSPRGFVINGRSLGEFVELGNRLCVFSVERSTMRSYVKQLLLRERSALPSGRCPLYVCERCGDLGCGAVSVRVSEVEDCFVWSELSYESFSGASPITWRDERLERDFYFARADYLAAIY